MLAPVCLEKPGMLTRDTPTNQASLVPSGFNHSVDLAGPETDLEVGACSPDVQVARPSPVEEKVNDHCKRPCASRTRLLHRATSHDAAAVLVLAYDGLQRTQAILAYLEIVKRHVPGILQFLRETKHTYEQALLSYGGEDFASAREFASASAELSLLLDIFISRTLRSDSTYPSIVPPPPQHAPVVAESGELDEELDQLATLLSRIHWLMENGTLPLEDRKQIRRIASWSDALYAQVRHIRANGPQDDAAEFMQAARAAANAAEHICRKWYVGDGTVRRPRPAPEQREA
jgi:hypothetical protein